MSPMRRFNIFKAFSSKSNNPIQPTTEAELTPDHSQQDEEINTQSLPSRKARTLTKRRKPISTEIEPSYNFRREDIGHSDLGRYPTKLPDPIVPIFYARGDNMLIPPFQLVDPSNPQKYVEPHARSEFTRLEYPTTNYESFHPMSQSSKRWSAVPDIYREPTTGEDVDNTNLVAEPSGPHYLEPHHGQGPSRPTQARGLHPPRRNRSVANHEPRSPITDDMNTTYGHGIDGASSEMPSNPRLEDIRGFRYVRDHTIHDGVLQGASMRATPLNLSARQPSVSQRSYARDDFQEPIIFEHEVLRDGDPHPKIWHYIVPGGLDVLFKDEEGNELTRVRNIGSGPTGRRVTPMVVEDEHGHIIHRTGNFDSLASSSRRRHGEDQPHKEHQHGARYQKAKRGNPDSEPLVKAPTWTNQRPGSPTRHIYTSYVSPEAEKVILIDEHGRQIPIADRRKRKSARRRPAENDAG